MTAVWLLAAALAIVVAFATALPLLRPARADAAGAARQAAYRAQLDDLRREQERGTLDAATAEATRAEIGRRLLQAADEGAAPTDAGPPARLTAAALVLAVVALSAGLYFELGNAGLPDMPLAERLEARQTEMAAAGDIDSRIRQLEERLAADPGDLEGWWLLGRSYGFLQRYGEAAEAYRQAVTLSGERADMVAAYAEALTLANGNEITPAARLMFEQVLSDMPEDPRARYYVGLAQAQAQDFQGALERWLALRGDSPAGAPWLPLVERGIVDMARFLDLDLASVAPDLAASRTGAAADAAAGDPRAEIARLTAALEAEPKDYENWIALADNLVAAGDPDAARESLRSAAGIYAGAPFVQQQLAAAAARLGLAEPAAAGRGPDAGDIAAASEMTEAERTIMIEGMVAGLAERLKAEPDDLDGWVMLVRSFAVLGRRDDAAEAYGVARAHFAGEPAALAALDRTAAEFGLDG